MVYEKTPIGCELCKASVCACVRVCAVSVSFERTDVQTPASSKRRTYILGSDGEKIWQESRVEETQSATEV